MQNKSIKFAGFILKYVNNLNLNPYWISITDNEYITIWQIKKTYLCKYTIQTTHFPFTFEIKAKSLKLLEKQFKSEINKKYKYLVKDLTCYYKNELRKVNYRRLKSAASCFVDSDGSSVSVRKLKLSESPQILGDCVSPGFLFPDPARSKRPLCNIFLAAFISLSLKLSQFLHFQNSSDFNL